MTIRGLPASRFPSRPRAGVPGRALVRAAVAACLVGLTLTPAAADRPPVTPTPWSAAASAVRATLVEAAAPATQAASAVRQAAAAAPAPSALAASAASAAMTAALGAVLGPASAPATKPSLPATSAPAAPLATQGAVAASCLRASDGAQACAPSQQLSLTPIALPAARAGAPYRPRRLVFGGVAPYRLEVLHGRLPEGLAFTPDGTLAGTTAEAPGEFLFTARISDASTSMRSVQQVYSIRVVPPPPPAPARPAASAATPPATPAPMAEPDHGPAQITSFMLVQADLDARFPPAAAAAAGDAASAPRDDAPPAPAGASAPAPVGTDAAAEASADDMRAMLAPLVNADFPTESLFVSAVRARRCAYYRSVVREAARAAGQRVPADALACPPTVPAVGVAASGAAGAAPLPLVPATFYADLLPDTTMQDLVAMARTPHRLDTARTPRWSDNGCGCVPPASKDWNYGVFPFWQAQADAPQRIDFSLYSRIGYLGAQLTRNGGLRTAGTLDADHAGFIREARRFGTGVDLVVQRADWTDVLGPPHQDEFITRAVNNIMTLVDTPLNGGAAALRRHLLPGWNEPTRLFDGVTLFFDHAPTDAAGRRQFKAFYLEFMHRLIGEMQKRGHPYALNLVAPATEIGDPQGAYGFEQLWNYIHLAQKPTSVDTVDGAVPGDYIGTTDIIVSVLAMLDEPVGDAGKRLRARADDDDPLHGRSRVGILNAVAPVVFHAGGYPAAASAPEGEPGLEGQLAYFKWQFGGTTLWPVTRADGPPGADIDRALRSTFSPGETGLAGVVSRWVCPNRTLVRAVFMLLLATGAVAFLLYFGVCAVRRLGRPYLLFLWLGGVLTLCVGLALLVGDPQLRSVREGNDLLFALLAVAVAGGMYASLKPRIAPP